MLVAERPTISAGVCALTADQSQSLTVTGNTSPSSSSLPTRRSLQDGKIAEVTRAELPDLVWFLHAGLTEVGRAPAAAFSS